MSILIEKKGSNNPILNTGKGKQGLYGATINYALTKEDFAFDSIEDAKKKTVWDTAKEAKDVIPMFSVEGSELSNSEPTYYEARTVKTETKSARKGIKFKHHLDLYSHAAIKSCKDSNYTRIIEFTEDGKILLIKEDGKLKGQSISEFIVPMKNQPVVGGDIATTNVEVVYKDYNELEENGHVLNPDFDVENYEGIYNVVLAIVGSPTSTEIKVSAVNYDGNAIDNLVLADFKLLDSGGSELTISGASYDDNESCYILTGSAFTTGTLSTDGVIVQSQIMYEAEAPIAVTI
jgi:hypothetical protein